MTDGKQPGILASFRRLGDTALGAIQNRLELLALELAEEKRWLVGTLIWTAASIFFSGLAVVTLTATVVAFSPAKARPFVLLGMAVLYSIAAAVAISKTRTHTSDRSMPLASTVSELKKDLASFREPSQQTSTIP